MVAHLPENPRDAAERVGQAPTPRGQPFACDGRIGVSSQDRASEGAGDGAAETLERIPEGEGGEEDEGGRGKAEKVHGRARKDEK